MNTIVTNSDTALGICVVDIYKNGVGQNFLPAINNTTGWTGADAATISLNYNMWISCNGTDVITMTILTDFSAGATTATTSLLFMSV